MNDSHETEQLGDENVKHQPNRVHVSAVARVAIGLAAMVVVSMIGMVFLFRGMDVAVESELPDYATRQEDFKVPPPQLDAAQSRQLEQLRAAHRRILNSYEWVDEQAGIARIPIQRAMELVTDQLPARDNRG